MTWTEEQRAVATTDLAAGEYIEIARVIVLEEELAKMKIDAYGKDYFWWSLPEGLLVENDRNPLSHNVNDLRDEVWMNNDSSTVSRGSRLQGNHREITIPVNSLVKRHTS